MGFKRPWLRMGPNGSTCRPTARTSTSIEVAFAKLKAALRAAAARGWDDLPRATAAALATFTPEHCANFFRHAQYATT